MQQPKSRLNPDDESTPGLKGIKRIKLSISFEVAAHMHQLGLRHDLT